MRWTAAASLVFQDGVVIYRMISEDWPTQGVIFTDLHRAVHEHSGSGQRNIL